MITIPEPPLPEYPPGGPDACPPTPPPVFSLAGVALSLYVPSPPPAKGPPGPPPVA